MISTFLPFLDSFELCTSVSRLWQVLHYDGLRRAARADPSALQLPVQQDSAGSPGRRGLHRRGLLHGDLQREGPRPARPQRVRKHSGKQKYPHFIWEQKHLRVAANRLKKTSALDVFLVFIGI